MRLKRQSAERLRKDTDAIIDFSNQLTTATANLNELRQVNLILTNDLASSRQEALTLSNQFTEASGKLAGTNASLQNAQNQINNLNSRLADLEAQNQVLDRRAAALTNAIAGLNAQIAGTQQKLAGAETNNAFLQKELQRQTAARAELENKFNNLSTVRTQVKKLRDELFVARRLEWMREGTEPGSQPKGGQLLMQRTGVRQRAPAALRFERRSQLRWLHPRHSIADQRARGDDKSAAAVTGAVEIFNLNLICRRSGPFANHHANLRIHL